MAQGVNAGDAIDVSEGGEDLLGVVVDEQETVVAQHVQDAGDRLKRRNEVVRAGMFKNIGMYINRGMNWTALRNKEP